MKEMDSGYRMPDAMPNEHNTLIGCVIKGSRIYNKTHKEMDNRRVVHFEFERIRGGNMHFIVSPWHGFLIALDLVIASIWSLISIGDPRTK